jgi:hypothetical protein
LAQGNKYKKHYKKKEESTQLDPRLLDFLRFLLNCVKPWEVLGHTTLDKGHAWAMPLHMIAGLRIP